MIRAQEVQCSVSVVSVYFPVGTFDHIASHDTIPHNALPKEMQQ